MNKEESKKLALLWARSFESQKYLDEMIAFINGLLEAQKLPLIKRIQDLNKAIIISLEEKQKALEAQKQEIIDIVKKVQQVEPESNGRYNTCQELLSQLKK